ncbi:unnamed protein product [Polarella glacialis]|uniref:Uncharacterized protein n=1 Tax=Polarella glacialis TaxID=89957 RepID=A0A813H998_POLGL|nr:unnamed protein product [Polarella glacialis]
MRAHTDMAASLVQRLGALYCGSHSRRPSNIRNILAQLPFAGAASCPVPLLRGLRPADLSFFTSTTQSLAATSDRRPHQTSPVSRGAQGYFVQPFDANVTASFLLINLGVVGNILTKRLGINLSSPAPPQPEVSERWAVQLRGKPPAGHPAAGRLLGLRREDRCAARQPGLPYSLSTFTKPEFRDLLRTNFLPVLTRAACRTQPCLRTECQPQRRVLLVLDGVASLFVFVCESDLSRSASAVPDDFSPGRPTFRRASASLRLLRRFKQLQPLLVRACHAQCCDLFAPTHGMSMQRLLSTCVPPAAAAAAALPARLQLQPTCLPAPSSLGLPRHVTAHRSAGRSRQSAAAFRLGGSMLMWMQPW